MSKKQLSEEYKNMMGAAAKVAFITAVRRNHEATLSDVAEMAKSEGLGDLTVGEVFFDEKVDFGGMQALPAKEKPAKRRKSQGVSTGAVDTRRVADRVGYDARLLAAVSGGRWLSAQELRAEVGGTPLQARKALNRLIEANSIRFKGKARATKYRLPKGKKSKNKKKNKGKNQAAA